MSDSGQQPDGWLQTLRRTGDSVLRLVESRMELFVVELQEQRLRAVNHLLWLALTVALGVVGLVLLFGALALFLWSVAGYYGLIGLALVALGAAFGVLWKLRQELSEGPRPFAATIAEFEKDRECLQKKN